MALQPLLGHLRVRALVRREPAARRGGELLHDEEADVVPGGGVVGAGVAQTDDEPGRGVGAHGVILPYGDGSSGAAPAGPAGTPCRVGPVSIGIYPPGGICLARHISLTLTPKRLCTRDYGAVGATQVRQAAEVTGQPVPRIRRQAAPRS